MTQSLNDLVNLTYFVLFHLGFYEDEIYSCFDQTSGLTWSDNYDDWNWPQSTPYDCLQMKNWAYQDSLMKTKKKWEKADSLDSG